MESLCRRGLSAQIIVVDMAPEIPEKIAIEMTKLIAAFAYHAALPRMPVSLPPHLL
jgi:hypothetical protein